MRGGERSTILRFTRSDGQGLHPAYVSRYFTTLVRRHGLPPIRLHDLRRTSVSIGLAGGERLLEVSRRLGHSSITITAVWPPTWETSAAGSGTPWRSFHRRSPTPWPTCSGTCWGTRPADRPRCPGPGLAERDLNATDMVPRTYQSSWRRPAAPPPGGPPPAR
jgi:hypothetical protein